jgi:exopolysaccharide biosynthesis polyprenyl glycosylphosphotransferase
MNLAAPFTARGAHDGQDQVKPLARSLERLRLQLYLGQMAIDVIVLFGSFMLAALIYDADPFRRSFLLPAQLLLPIFLTIALYNGTYSLPSLQNWRTGVARAFTALLISAALLNFVAFFAQLNRSFSRVGFLLAMVVAVLALSAARRLSAVAIRRMCGPSPLNVLVIDDDGPPIALPDTYRVSAAEQGLTPALDDPHSLDRLARYVANMDQVLVACPAERRVAWAMALKGAGVHSEVTSDFMNEIGALSVVRRDDAGLTTLLVATGPLGMRARVLKRGFDIVATLAALLVVAPVLALAALAIKLEDGGPVLFRQRRIGRRNGLFAIYKLRTMSVDGSDGDGHRSTSKGDARITRVGHFLRKTSIDELPQLLNVLKGDMSLVGPRPHAIGSLAGDKLFWEVDQRYWHRHSLRPGLTGLAQVRGLRGATDLQSDLSSRLQADLDYLAGWTILRDIGILFATVRVLVHDRAF